MKRGVLVEFVSP